MVLRDSTNPFDIPLDGLSAVAGYGDGGFAWSAAGWARFPASVVALSIVTSAASAGDILDVETGDATPANCPGWADRFRRPGRRLPSIYCNRATIGAVRQTMRSRPFDWWAATLDGQLHSSETAGAVAVQWKGEAQTGGHYDESLIQDPGWIGQPSGGNDMAQLDGIQASVDAQWDFHVFGTPSHGSPAPILGLVPGIAAKLDLILKGQGLEQAALDALSTNAAAASQVTAVKAELDQVAAAQAGGTPASLAALQAAVDRLAAHLGEGTP